MNTDAAVPGLNRNNVYRLLIVVPAVEILETSATYLDRWRNLAISLKNNSTDLANLRDTLLPKLLSGELTVGETMDEATNVPEAVF